MRMKQVELRCATYKFSEQTREKIERIKADRQKADQSLFGDATYLSNTDVLRFLIDQEILAIERRAAERVAQDHDKQRKEVKIANQRARRLLKKGSGK
jgi:hypothetical protein